MPPIDDDLGIPDPKDHSFTLDNDSSASNPGRTHVQPWVWVAHHPKWPLLLGGSLLASLAGGWWLHWSLWIIGALLVAMNWLYWTRIKEHFRGEPSCLLVTAGVGELVPVPNVALRCHLSGASRGETSD